MDDLRDKAIKISNKFQFSEFKSSATAVNGGAKTDEAIASCENHLDVDFMKLLEQGAHLDFIRRVREETL